MQKLLFILFLASTAFGQNRKFLIQVNKEEPFTYSYSAGQNGRLDLINFDSHAVAWMLLEGFEEYQKIKNRPVLEQDSVLNKICLAAVKTIGKSRFRSRKHWKKEQKNLRYALKISNSNYKLFQSFAFTVDALDLPKGAAFYFDRRNEDCALQLYKGKPSYIRDPEHPDYVEPEPIYAKTDRMLMEEFVEMFRRKAGLWYVSSEYYSRIGLAVRLEERSIHRKKRPYLYVILMIAGKQNQFVKKKDRLEQIEKFYLGV